eukprot:TRINITY_DN9843_c0_g1_i1.p1 TRINITY_DN9843_c0_g1~~TRINITY_DN9843_c0_g1_i1.p1  ORF type:complete len:242 (-),score=15.46 TRINITY_DN9843_c0_g1_i1:589-1314(-)
MSLADLKTQFIHERSLGLPLLSVLKPSIGDFLIAEIDQRSPQELTSVFIKSWSVSLGGFVPLSPQFLSGHIQCHFKIAGVDIGDDVDETVRQVTNLADAVGAGRCSLTMIPDALVNLRVHCVVEWWVRMIINQLAGVQDPNRPFACDEAAALLLTDICLEYCEYALKRLNRPVHITAFNEIALERLGPEDAVAFYESEANCPLPAASCPLRPPRNSSSLAALSSNSSKEPAGGETNFGPFL